MVAVTDSQFQASPVKTVEVRESARPQTQEDDNVFRSLSLSSDVGSYKLKDALEAFAIDAQDSIPFLIWLLENPKSAIALPGKVDLFGHDCIHLLLNRGVSNFDEAFIIGFTMGNDTSLKDHHIKIFRTFSTRLYPPVYRFNKYHMKSFELGLKYGQQVPHKNINRVDFKLYSEATIQTIRSSFGISIDDIKKICKPENIWIQMAAAFA